MRQVVVVQYLLCCVWDRTLTHQIILVLGSESPCKVNGFGVVGSAKLSHGCFDILGVKEDKRVQYDLFLNEL